LHGKHQDFTSVPRTIELMFGEEFGQPVDRFSALSGVSAMIETVPLERAADAYAKMMAGKARFRTVLTMG
jgi:D-arabinose 1-dehydrogenase-like Zn-dependent alcohol dehydrogenase